MKIRVLLILASVLSSGVLLGEDFKPKDGFVPDEKTAVAIAVAVWSPIYGEGKIKNEKPYKATLNEGIWHVEGTLPKGHLGGVAEIKISKQDAKIISIKHGQ